MTKQTVGLERLGTTFHRTFLFVRSAISQVLKISKGIYGSDAKNVTFDRIREGTNLGKIYAEAMPRYAIGAGLLGRKSKTLTRLGEVVSDYDPDLNHPTSLWLAHYHLSAPKGPGALFWNHLVSHELRTGTLIERKQLIDSVKRMLTAENIELGDEQIDRSVSVFTGTYIDGACLGNLNILKEVDSQDGMGERKRSKNSAAERRSKVFEVQEPDAPPVYALGYALAHFWDQQIGALRTDLSDLSAPGGFAGLFFLGSYQLNAALRELQREGYLELEQIAPPHQVVRRWESPEAFLERLYE
jgi:hypothetical protein